MVLSALSWLAVIKWRFGRCRRPPTSTASTASNQEPGCLATGREDRELAGCLLQPSYGLESLGLVSIVDSRAHMNEHVKIR